MQLNAGGLTWDWIEPWAQLPPMSGHSHHGLVMDRRGRLITGHASEPRILILDQEGRLLDEFATPVQENHGICIGTEADGSEFLLIADCIGSQMVKCDFNGTLLARIGAADVPGFEEGGWFGATAPAFDPRSGDIWLADGYGSQRLFKFDRQLQLQCVLDGTTGAGRFQQPHWVFVDTRQAASRIYVADRQAHRVQVFQPDGQFIRSFGEGVLRTPSVFATFGNHLVIGELQARLVLCDADDEIIGFLGDGFEHVDKPGWPNRHDAAGETIAPTQDLPVGQFNSPHGLCAADNGDLYISEWLLGDRFIKLQCQSKGAAS